AAQGWARLPSGGPSGEHLLMIDAQLTTEFFGALCPGMPERALEMADLPIRTTAWGYAAHAAQFYVVLYSLASQVDSTLTGEAQALWLVREARKYLPDTSISSAVIDFVLADYLANPDKQDWEATRDRVYQRFVIDAAQNNTRYWGWYESKVNLATGVIALLYGQMDFCRTVQIGTLSGWDSDNGTATMGGLIGLVQGPAYNKPAYGWPAISNRFWISRTRQNLPDYTPSDPQAEDTFPLMAARMLPIIDREVASAGGKLDQASWLLPPGGAGPGIGSAVALGRSPTQRLMSRSANTAVRAAGGNVTPISSVSGTAPSWEYGWPFPSMWVDGAELDANGRELWEGYRGFTSTYRSVAAPGVPQMVGVEYDREVPARTVRLTMGETYVSGPVQGGWCDSPPTLELRIAGVWTSVAATASTTPGPGTPWAVIDFQLPASTTCSGARVTCLPGGPSAFVTIAELDVLAPQPPASMPTFDVDGDGVVGIDDLYAAHEPGRLVDLNADGTVDRADLDYLEMVVRFGETSGMAGSRGSRPAP
ncbi:MAG: ADP-ribosylglycohydrolase family protein, partial [Phycisphaerales bacterium]|nr:ADP-ribosylglycohydrolase family protein [Phycisphaerales bacterium]